MKIFKNLTLSVLITLIMLTTSVGYYGGTGAGVNTEVARTISVLMDSSLIDNKPVNAQDLRDAIHSLFYWGDSIYPNGKAFINYDSADSSRSVIIDFAKGDTIDFLAEAEFNQIGLDTIYSISVDDTVRVSSDMIFDTLSVHYLKFNGDEHNTTAAISTNVTDISGNTSNITQNATNISSNVTNISGNTSNISQNATNISSNVTNISGNTSNITQNATNISSNVTNISGNTSNISQNASDITSTVSSLSLGQSFSTLTSSYTGSAVTSIAVTALPVDIPDNTKLCIIAKDDATRNIITLNGNHALSATTLTIDSYAVNANSGSGVQIIDESLQSQITQNDDNINLKVSKNDVINQINISTEGIDIQADNLRIGADTYFETGHDPSEKSRVFRQISTIDPTGMFAGDVWYKTNLGNQLWVYDGADWIQGYTQISGGHITTGTISANRITTLGDITATGTITGGTLSGSTISGGTITGATIQTNATTGQRVIMSGTTIDFKDEDNLSHTLSGYPNILDCSTNFYAPALLTEDINVQTGVSGISFSGGSNNPLKLAKVSETDRTLKLTNTYSGDANIDIDGDVKGKTVTSGSYKIGSTTIIPSTVTGGIQTGCLNIPI